MKISDDYLPDSALNTRDWCKNIITNGPAKLLALGWVQTRIDAFIALVTQVQSAADAAVQAQQKLDAAMGTLKTVRATELPGIRAAISGLKTTPGYDDGLGALLGIIGASTTVDSTSYQPQIHATSVAHGIQISGKKLGASSLNLYSRVRGQSSFKLLATKRVGFPFLDDTPPATAGASEIREYQAIGVSGDDEFGQPSDIVSAAYNP
jgi:hypothetical protein